MWGCFPPSNSCLVNTCSSFSWGGVPILFGGRSRRAPFCITPSCTLGDTTVGRGGASLALTAPQQVGGGVVANRAQSDLGRAVERQRRRWGRPHTPRQELTFSEARAGVYFKTTAPPPRRRHSGAARAAAAAAAVAAAAATGRRAGRGGGGGGGRHSPCRRRRRAGGVVGGRGGRKGSFLKGRLCRQRCDCDTRRRHRSEARTIALAPRSR